MDNRITETLETAGSTHDERVTGRVGVTLDVDSSDD